MSFDWKKIWNDRKFNEMNKYEFNGYQFNDEHQYNKFIYEITKSLPLKNNQKILDIGCGNGSLIN